MEVYRRQSKKQPCPGDRSVDWQETVYLNLILQQVVFSFSTCYCDCTEYLFLPIFQIEYVLTCAVCTKTSPQNLQILRKNSQVPRNYHIRVLVLNKELN